MQRKSDDISVPERSKIMSLPQFTIHYLPRWSSWMLAIALGQTGLNLIPALQPNPAIAYDPSHPEQSDTVAQNLTVPTSDRWLEIQRTSGSVTLNGSTARTGQRLDSVGDRIVTGANSDAYLLIDTSIGSVYISANTELQVTSLSTQSDGSRVTLLSVRRGQARIQARTFTNPNTRLELESPSGVAAVRGTDFGVSVGPTGQTAILTIEGIVAANAQGETVEVPADFSSIIVPGEPPTPARPTVEDLRLQVSANENFGGRRVTVRGSTDPVNLVTLNGDTITTDENGRFRIEARSRGLLNFVVLSPLGNERVYTITTP
jgi:hypothetical protein